MDSQLIYATLNSALSSLQDILNYNFKDRNLLISAITHPSFAYESKEEKISHNQRLEFLGDSILNMVIAEYLYEKNPILSEGELSRLRALMVNKNFLSQRAKKINLGQYLLLGKGEEKLGGRQNSTNLASALEAIIAAIYLDGGLGEAKRFILEIIVQG